MLNLFRFPSKQDYGDTHDKGEESDYWFKKADYADCLKVH
jgi:hypothetical protein